ncbi:MAG TPA: deaminase [Terriglobales bacterium]|nr:deaminase [Terriglobales bacterium]
MELLPRVIVGLTGAFGSGCTTAAKYLRDTRGFVPVRLSDSIRAEWSKNHKEDPSRLDLQKIGDELRQKNHAGILVELALSELEKKNGGKLPESVVIDGIRNLGEISYLRDVYGFRFTLAAILASSEARWARIGTAYTDKGLGLAEFVADDQRDQNEETDYGQQVELCVDKADILINNTVISTPEFQKKVVELIDLATGKRTRSAMQTEILMNIAFSSAHSSKCIKRHVGAVVADANGQVVSAGYNENPLGTNPCIEEPEYHQQCFRDIMRNEHFETLSKKGARCPVCGEKIIFQPGPPWRCKACTDKGAKTNLESFFFPDRAMNWCTAVHAEVWAILAAGERSRGGVLYTTTFPCAQCAEKIVQAGIVKVIFTEPYPDVYGANRLNLGGIELEQFEGVRSSSFERIFSRTKPD